jgi:hypothetical protein
MKSILFCITLLLFCSTVLQAQKKDEPKPKKTAGEILKELPDMLIAQPETAPDTNANKLMNDNLSMVLHPLWKEKGLQTIIEYKLLKTEVEPLASTLPFPSKKLVNGLSINMNTVKKTPEEKKQQVLGQVKTHLAAVYKEAEKTIDQKSLAEKVNSMVVSSEPLTTDQGKQGTIYYINDVETRQSNFTVLFTMPGNTPNATAFVQINYFHYNYETTFNEDPLEWRVFVFEEDQQEFINFTKKMLKTFRIG